jgi:DNA-binding HxlR family transcriptional regulator
VSTSLHIDHEIAQTLLSVSRACFQREQIVANVGELPPGLPVWRVIRALRVGPQSEAELLAETGLASEALRSTLAAAEQQGLVSASASAQDSAPESTSWALTPLGSDFARRTDAALAASLLPTLGQLEVWERLQILAVLQRTLLILQAPQSPANEPPTPSQAFHLRMFAPPSNPPNSEVKVASARKSRDVQGTTYLPAARLGPRSFVSCSSTHGIDAVAFCAR